MYYIILAAIDLIAFSITSTLLERLQNAIRDNWLCEAVRTDPNQSCPREFESIRLTEAFSFITYCLLGLFPLVNLLFAVNIQEVKEKFKRWCTTYDSRSRTASTSLGATAIPDSPPFSLRRNKSYSLGSRPVSMTQVGTIGKAGKFLNKTAV